MVEGNIYDNADTKTTADKHPCVEEAEVDNYKFRSTQVEGLSAEVATKL